MCDFKCISTFLSEPDKNMLSEPDLEQSQYI